MTASGTTTMFQTGRFQGTGLMCVNAICHVHVNSLKLLLMVSVTVSLHIISIRGKTTLDGLNILALGAFKGNIWTGDGTTKIDLGFFFDEKANEKQREALNMIFTGQAGGFMAELARLIGNVRGIEFAPIKFEIADDLSYWSAEIPGKVLAKAEALTGPMTPLGKRVQTINAPGSETGPGTIATWGKSTADQANAMGFKWERKGQSSKHIPFEWSGP
jgi:hypothetical protein